MNDGGLSLGRNDDDTQETFSDIQIEALTVQYT